MIASAHTPAAIPTAISWPNAAPTVSRLNDCAKPLATNVTPAMLVIASFGASEKVRHALQQSEVFQRSLFAAARVAVMSTDFEGRLTSFNPFAEKLTGYRATGQDVVAKVRQSLGPRTAKADTATLTLPVVS